MPELYTIKEVTEILKTSDKTIRKEIANGSLECVRVGGQYRITREQIDKYLNRRIVPNYYKGR